MKKEIRYRIPYTIPHRDEAEYVYVIDTKKGESESTGIPHAIQFVRDHVPGAVIHDPKVHSVEVCEDQRA